jgi:plasmid maintenance system killer protein
MINNAQIIDNLRIPPENGLEILKGDLSGAPVISNRRQEWLKSG